MKTIIVSLGTSERLFSSCIKFLGNILFGFFPLDLFCSAEDIRDLAGVSVLISSFPKCICLFGSCWMSSWFRRRLIRNQKQVSCKWVELCGGQDCESHERAFFPTCQWSVTGSPETYPSDGGAGQSCPFQVQGLLEVSFSTYKKMDLVCSSRYNIFFSRKMISPSTLAPHHSVLIFEWISRSRKTYLNFYGGATFPLAHLPCLKLQS